MGNKFGWHSGTVTCKDAKVKGDLYVQDDIVFSDVSAGVLGITGGVDMQSTVSAIGIDMGGTHSTAAINIDGTLTGRAIRIGSKNLPGTTTDGSLKISTTGYTLDVEPSNNYLFGLFSKVSASEATSSDELRGAWIRTRVNDGCHVGSNAGWGYGVCGAEIQLKVYATSAATNMYSWQNSAIWAQLETQGASGINFKSGSYSQAVLANVGLTSTTTIDSGAVVSGVTINSNTSSSNVTATGGFYGLFITDKSAANLDFQYGIYIGNSVATSGIYVGTPSTAGIVMPGGASYNPIHIGTKSNSADAGLILTGSVDDTGGIMVFCDDGNDALANITSPIWTRYLLTQDTQSSGATATGAYFQFKTKPATTTITASNGSYTATKSFLEIGAGGVTLTGGELAVINAGVGMSANLVNTSGRFSGIDVNINTSTNTITDTIADTAAIHIRKTSSSTYGWPVGLKINDSGTTTGIKIGTCTTGINIGNVTTGIDFTGTATRGIRLGTHDWGAGSTGIALTKTDPLMQIAGKVTTTGADGVYCNFYSQEAITTTQNKGSYIANWNELYISGTTTLTGVGNIAAVWGYINTSGTTVSGTGNITALNGAIEIPATFTNNGVLSCLQVDMILNNGYTDNGIIAGIQFGEHTDPGQNRIPYGLNFDTGACACFARFPDDEVIADANGTLGAAAGYILVNIGGTNYKLQTYATA